MTAHYLLHATFIPAPGDTILIHAGAGGTGLLLIQLAKRLGVQVITTVSTAEKATLARAAGADHVILYTEEDVVARVHDITRGAKLPVVYDSVGRSTFEQSLLCLRPRGTLVLFGGASGAVPPFDLIRLSTLGSLYITRPTLKDYISTREDLLARANEHLPLRRRRHPQPPHRPHLPPRLRRPGPPRPRIPRHHRQTPPPPLTARKLLT